MPIQPKQQPPYYESGISVKEYIAILSQTGTANPVVQQLIKNTIGTITWTRLGVGDYQGATSGLLSPTKTIATPFTGNGAVLLPMYYDSTGSYQISPQDEDNIRLWTFAINDINTPKEWSTIGGTILVTIQVYQ